MSDAERVVATVLGKLYCLVGISEAGRQKAQLLQYAHDDSAIDKNGKAYDPATRKWKYFLKRQPEDDDGKQRRCLEGDNHGWLFGTV